MSDRPADLHDGVQNEAPSWGDLRAKVDHFAKAYEYLNSAPFNGDPEVVKAMLLAADIHARIGLGDKLEELNQTIKHVIGRQTEVNAALTSEIKRATNLREANMRRASVRPAA